MATENQWKAISDGSTAAVQAVGAGVVTVGGRCGRSATGVAWGDGLIVAAHHAVEREERVGVTLPDGSDTTATVVGRDPGTDLAVLRLDASGSPPTAPAWRDTGDVRVGELVLSLARPGRSVRATFGVVSVVGPEYRTALGSKVERYLESDAAPLPGGSGGPLIDLDGHVLGILTQALVRGGTRVAVPTETVRRVVGEITAHGRVRRGYLGVGVYPVRFPPSLQQLAGQRGGALVVAVEPGGPAEKAGVLLGDVLLTIDGLAIGGPGELTGALHDRIDREVPARILRAGALLDLRVTPGVRP